MNTHLSRAQMLLQQERYDLAEKELRQELVQDPEDAYTRALLALCLGYQDRHGEADREAHEAIHLAPDFAFAHYAHALVLEQQDRTVESEAAIREAIRQDGEDADYWAHLSAVLYQQRRWPEALAAAETGLRLEANHVGCANFHAMALTQMGRKQEAGAALQTALQMDPENALTHANQGWTLLHRNKPHEAMAHFQEALRLEPGMQWAREGVLEALRARNPVYRAMLAYFLWMSRLSSQAQQGVLIGGIVLSRVLRGLLIVPSLRPIILPLLILYWVFVYLTWTSQPMFNLFLQWDSFGRLALTRDQRVGSNWFGLCLGIALAGVGLWLATHGFFWLLCGGVALALSVPVAATFQSTKRRQAYGGFSIALAALGVIALASVNTTAFPVLIGAFGLAFVVFTWIGGLGSVRD